MMAHQRLAALRETSNTQLVDALRRDSSDVVRHEAAFVLGERKQEGKIVYFISEAQSALMAALEDDCSILVRHEAALSLAHFADEEVVTALIRRFEAEKASEVRDSIIYALVSMLAE